MRALIRTSIVWVSLACTAVAQAAPRVDTRNKYTAAAQLDDNGDHDQALAVIEEGLAAAPTDLGLLGLKGTVLLEIRDYVGALAAYQAYLDAGATGAKRREAQKIVNNLRAVQSTFLDIALTNGPAAVYLESKSQGVFCTAAPACHKGVLPGSYKVIAERPGFDRWTGRVTVASDKAATVAITLVEKPSSLAVRVAQPDAHILVDDAAYDPAAPLAAGPHRVVVSLDGYEDARLEVAAHEGKPVALDVALVPVRVVVAPSPPPPVVRHAEAPPSSRTRRLAGLGVAAGGGVAVAVGLVFGAKARSSNSDAKALCGADLVCDSASDFDRGHQLISDARSQATISTVLVVAGGAAIATGLIVWATAPGGPAAAKEHPQTARAARTAQKPRIVPILNGTSDLGLAVLGTF